MNNDEIEISPAQQLKRIGDAYASMYAPKEEPVPEEIETKSEEDKNVTPT
jgi:hypothetical protein